MRKGHLFLAAIAVEAAIFPVALYSPARAQAPEATCLVRPIGDASAGQTVSLAVSSENAPALQARGYAIKVCEGEQDQQAALHDDVCRLASIAPPTVQVRFEERYGVTPAELCALTAAGGGN